MPEDSADEYTAEDRLADEQLERITDLANQIYDICGESSLNRQEAIAALHFVLSRLHTPPLGRG